MSAVRWKEGDPLPVPTGKPYPVSNEEVQRAWAATKAALESKGWQFRDHEFASHGVVKFGFTVTEIEDPASRTRCTLQSGMNSLEAALVEHFGPEVSKGLVLVRAKPAALCYEGESRSPYVRARFGFVRDEKELGL